MTASDVAFEHLMAIAEGRWLLSTRWLTDSAQERRLKPEVHVNTVT